MNDLQPITTLPRCPDRPANAHKGTFGTVIVVGGCATMIGAPALCASAALRSGVGLVKIAADGSLLPTMLAIEPGATGIVLNSIASIDQADEAHDAVLAVGPGISCSASAQHVVMELLQGDRTIVLDADGLNLLARTGQPRPGASCKVVLTPHPGEFARLASPLGIIAGATDPATRPAAAAKLATAHRAVVVLKGRNTIVTDGQRTYTNQTGNPALATAGSGDVLTGLIAALIAQGMADFEAAILGVYLHGLTADRWADQHGQSGLTASDLARMLPDTFSQHRQAT